jgi:dTDP-4-dehydrorhamnose reductase
MTPRSILIFGKGQLSGWYQSHFAAKGATVTVADADVRDGDAVRDAIASVKPDLAVNVAGKTNIDWCEQHREETFAVNVLGADNVARACQESDTALVHVSSGCVQESVSADHMHDEESTPNPVCFYAWTKVWGDNLVMDRVTRHGLKGLVLRPRQLLSAQLSPRNAIVKMLTYSKFIDTPNSCTVIEDMMDATSQLLEKDATGIVNLVNPGVTSPYRIALLLKERVKPEMTVTAITKEELNRMTFAKRIDAVLKTDRLASFGVTLRPIEDRLPEICDALAESLRAANADEVMAKTEKETEQKLALATQNA